MCPMGVNQSSTAIVGPAGGKVYFEGQQKGGLRLDIPPTALAACTTITITETNRPPPAAFVDFSPVFRVEPANLSFSVPVRVDIFWSNRSGLVVPNDQLLIYWSATGADGSWVPLPDSYRNAGFNQGSVQQAGGYAFVGAARGSTWAACP